MKKYFVVNLSGGKDSTAMLLRLIADGRQIDEIVYFDFGVEWPEISMNVKKLESATGRRVTRLRPPHPFPFFLLELENGKHGGRRGYGWPNIKMRWCTSIKTRTIDAYLLPIRQRCDVVQYIGIAADEPHRVKNDSAKRYPLVSWGMAERDCLKYAYERGFDFGGLYSRLKRVSCWCCPFTSLENLRALRQLHPRLWERLIVWDNASWSQYRRTYSAQELEIRFALEDERQAAGLQCGRSRDFFRALRTRLGR